MLSESKAMKRLRRKMENEVLWIYICYILKEGPKSMSEVKGRLKEEFGIKVSNVKLYMVMYRMEDEGLITKVESYPTKYSLTEIGDIEYRKAVLYLEERLMTLKRHLKM